MMSKHLCVSLAVAGLAALTACQSAPRQRQRLASAEPLEQVQAAVKLAETGDAAAVHGLVELLEADDPAVRMYAILALERLCGQIYGYEYYATEQEREEAVRRWREALRRGDVRVVHSRHVRTSDKAGGESSD